MPDKHLNRACQGRWAEPHVVFPLARTPRVAAALLMTMALSGVPYFEHAAWAQDSAGETLDVPATKYRPAVDRLGIFDTEWPAVPLAGSWNVRISMSAVGRPLVLNRQNVELGALVKERFTSRLGGAVTVFDRLQLSIAMPVVLYQTQDDILTALDGNPPPDAPALVESRRVGTGDLRLALKGQLLRANNHGIALGGLLTLALPTARGGLFFGEHGPIIEATAAIAGAVNKVRLAGNLGYRLRGDIAESYVVLTDEWLARMAARYQPTARIPLGVAVGLSGSFDERSLSPQYLESLVGLDIDIPVDVGGWGRGALSGFITAGAGLGDGLGLGGANGPGTPRWRIQLGISLGQRIRDEDGDGVADHRDSCLLRREDLDGYEDGDGCPEFDNDGDGVLDVDDKAPMEAEDHDGFGDGDGVPERDNDGDGFLDDKDSCPDLAETRNGWKDDDGCPDIIPDSDGDTLLDPQDPCPNDAEDRDGFEDGDGCPDPDNDGDGVLDASDRCPLASGHRDNRGCPDTDRDGDSVVDRLDHCPDSKGKPRYQGCKRRQFVSLRGQEIALMETLRFSSDGTRVSRRSNKVLRNIADIMKAHPNIALLEIQGHTDDRGDDEYNVQLSQRRADAARKYLIRAGVEPKRLVAHGFGETQPLESNATARGRARNRRVEFNIVHDDRDRQVIDSVSAPVKP